MSLYAWISLPIGLIGIGLICYCEYRSQAIVTRYQLHTQRMRTTERWLLGEFSDFNAFEARVSVVSATVVFTVLYFGLTKVLGLWAFVPLTLLIVAAMAYLLPRRISTIRKLEREMNVKPTPPAPPLGRQISSCTIIDAE